MMRQLNICMNFLSFHFKIKMTYIRICFYSRHFLLLVVMLKLTCQAPCC
ncbi:unnamed protein product [Ixodes persulcatus]